MIGKAGIKAGLIGLVILLIVTALNNLLSISGILMYVLCGLGIMIYVGIGTLAGLFLIPPRTPGKGAGAGAIAGLIGSGVNGTASLIITFIRLSHGLGMAGVTPQQMQQLLDAGYNPQAFLLPGIVCGLAIGASAAAVGGAVLAAVKPD
jgi:hypothetical protein